MTDRFSQIIEFTLQNEGGYVNDPNDAGGETNFGISKRMYPNLDIKNLTKDQAIGIYKREFWDPYPFDKINDFGICRKLFDMSVNMGASRAIKLLQAAEGNIAVDGRLGPISIQAINNDDPTILLHAYIDRIEGFYKQLAADKPSNQKFLKGWLRRASL